MDDFEDDIVDNIIHKVIDVLCKTYCNIAVWLGLEAHNHRPGCCASVGTGPGASGWVLLFSLVIRVE